MLVAAILGGLFLVGNVYSKRQINHQLTNATTRMFRTLKAHGKYKLNSGRQIILTSKGQKLLQPNLAFYQNGSEILRDLGFEFQNGRIGVAQASGVITLPANLKRGDLITGTLPFPVDAVTSNTKLVIKAGEHSLTYTPNHFERAGEDPNSRKFAIMIGYNFSDGKKIPDERYLLPLRGQQIQFEFTGLHFTHGNSTGQKQAIADQQLIEQHDINYVARDKVMSFTINSIGKKPRVANFTARLDGQDSTNAFTVRLITIKKYAKNVHKYRVVVEAKKNIVGQNLRLKLALDGDFSFVSYSSNSILHAY